MALDLYGRSFSSGDRLGLGEFNRVNFELIVSTFELFATSNTFSNQTQDIQRLNTAISLSRGLLSV